MSFNRIEVIKNSNLFNLPFRAAELLLVFTFLFKYIIICNSSASQN